MVFLSIHVAHEHAPLCAIPCGNIQNLVLVSVKGILWDYVKDGLSFLCVTGF